VSEFIVITGLSGAGRSQAADDLEDLGWFVIDNLPASLVPKVAELAQQPGATNDRVGLVVGPGPSQEDVLGALEQVRHGGARVRILFLDAQTDVLVRRYESTRRRHPMASDQDSLADAIDRERVILEPVKAQADVVVDTSDLNIHQLRQRVTDLFGEGDEHGMKTTVMSFGYKHGLPLDVDMVLDCRFLPNPHWVDDLRPLSGLDEPVRDYVVSQPAAQEFLVRLNDLLGLLLPAYVHEGKSYLTIALGCTGGRHRSVAIAEEVARILARHGHGPTVIHRDLDR
jgi:UPF0042 nucleotide-binding protein